MKTLHVNVANCIATYEKKDGELVCGNANYQIEFAFDKEWDKHEEKTARFKTRGKFADIKFTGNTCKTPIFYKVSKFEVGVFVENKLATTSAEIPCVFSVLCNNASEEIVLPESTDNGDNGGEGEAREIQFTVNDVPCHATSGMTWGEYLETTEAQDSGGWSTEDEYVLLEGIALLYEGERVTINDTITEGGSYYDETYSDNGGEAREIEFTVNDTTYTTTEGMTWGEFMQTADGDWSTEGEYVLLDGQDVLYEDDNFAVTAVKTDYAIIEGTNYYTGELTEISFSVDGKSYTVTKGTTWGEFVETTEAQDDGFSIEEKAVYLNGKQVHETDNITVGRDVAIERDVAYFTKD